MNHMNDNDRAWLAEMEKGEPDSAAVEYTEELRDRFVTVTGKTDKFNHKAFADWLVYESGNHFVTTRDDTVYIYDEGVYKSDGHTYIKTEMDRVMGGELLTPFMETAVIAKVRARTYAGRDVFEEGEDIINMDNGLYNIRTGEFRPHTPSYRSLAKSAVRYDPKAKCPAFDRFVGEVVEPHRVGTVYEMGGYALMRRKRVKRGFILLGRSDTGKTQLMNFLSEFVGSNATAAVNPIHIVRNDHAGAGLYGKHLNIVDDLGDAPLAETGVLKSMIGDGWLTCNEKNKKAFPFRPYVMNVWGCNVLPKTDDPYFGDKFDILKFLNVYGGHAKPDRYLIDKITTPEEMSGYFNKAVAAFRDVMKSGEFTGSSCQSDRQREWLEESTPVAKFVKKFCNLSDPDALMLKESFHKKYDLWIKAGDHKRERKKDIAAYLESNGVYSLKVTKRAEDLYGRWCYLGIRFDPKNQETALFLDQPPTYRKKTPDPTISSITTTTLKKEIVEGTIGTKVGSGGQKQGVDNDSGLNDVFGASGSKSQHPSEPIDFDQRTIDRVRKATSEAMIKSNNPDGCNIGEIARATKGLSASTVAKLLLTRCDAAGFVKTNGLYRIRT